MSPETRARLAELRRDRRLATAVFLTKAFGPAALFGAYLWWVTAR